MRPFFFGTAAQPLFGVYHPAIGKPVRRTAVLLCNPFGVEAIYAHRMYRVLAERLARTGFHTLRFDYYATGDSAGDGTESSLGRWTDDVLAANEELTDMAAVSRVAWVGLRLGATVATLASAQAQASVSSLVLWDPVVDGRAYIGEMRDAHGRFMEEDFEFRPPARARSSRRPRHDVQEVLGFPFPPRLRAEIESLDAASLSAARAGRVYVLTSPGGSGGQVLQATDFDERFVWRTTDPSMSWNSELALNSTVVPMAALDMIVQSLEEAK